MGGGTRAFGGGGRFGEGNQNPPAPPRPKSPLPHRVILGLLQVRGGRGGHGGAEEEEEEQRGGAHGAGGVRGRHPKLCDPPGGPRPLLAAPPPSPGRPSPTKAPSGVGGEKGRRCGGGAFQGEPPPWEGWRWAPPQKIPVASLTPLDSGPSPKAQKLLPPKIRPGAREGPSPFPSPLFPQRPPPRELGTLQFSPSQTRPSPKI